MRCQAINMFSVEQGRYNAGDFRCRFSGKIIHRGWLVCGKHYKAMVVREMGLKPWDLTLWGYQERKNQKGTP